MTAHRRAVVDEDSVLANLTRDEYSAWEELDRQRAEALVRWVLQARWQRSRRERVDDLRRMLRLQVADVEPPSVMTPRRWWELVLDPLIWWH
jgi:hypothetical protein